MISLGDLCTSDLIFCITGTTGKWTCYRWRAERGVTDDCTCSICLPLMFDAQRYEFCYPTAWMAGKIVVVPCGMFLYCDFIWVPMFTLEPDVNIGFDERILCFIMYKMLIVFVNMENRPLR